MFERAFGRGGSVAKLDHPTCCPLRAGEIAESLSGMKLSPRYPCARGAEFSANQAHARARGRAPRCSMLTSGEFFTGDLNRPTFAWRVWRTAGSDFGLAKWLVRRATDTHVTFSARRLHCARQAKYRGRSHTGSRCLQSGATCSILNGQPPLGEHGGVIQQLGEPAPKLRSLSRDANRSRLKQSALNVEREPGARILLRAIGRRSRTLLKAANVAPVFSAGARPRWRRNPAVGRWLRLLHCRGSGNNGVEKEGSASCNDRHCRPAFGKLSTTERTLRLPMACRRRFDQAGEIAGLKASAAPAYAVSRQQNTHEIGKHFTYLTCWGSVRKTGAQVHINAQLIDTRTIRTSGEELIASERRLRYQSEMPKVAERFMQISS